MITAAMAALLSIATSFGNPTFVAGKPKVTPPVDAGLVPPDDPGIVESHMVDETDPGMIEPVDDTDVAGYVPRRAAESEVGTVEPSA